MSTARLADITLSLDGDSLDFGGPSDETRTVKFRAIFDDATKDGRAGSIAQLNSRIAEPCDLLLQSDSSSYPVALHLLGGGEGRVQLDGPYELGNVAFLDVTVPCVPYAVPANRIFLASPIGDEWPDETECERSDAQYVFADGGRYRIDATAATSPTLTLYGDCVAGEQLIVENHYRVTTFDAATFDGWLTWLDSDGNAVGSDVKRLAYAAAASTTDVQRRYLYRAPTGAVGFKCEYSFSTPAGSCTAYVWAVVAGVQSPACSMSAPWRLDPIGSLRLCEWSDGTWPEHEYERYPAADGGGAAWTYASQYLTLTATALAQDSYIRTIDAVRVTPGQTIMVADRHQCTAYTDGTMRYRVWWYDEAGAFLSYTDALTRTATDGALVTETPVNVTAPDGAHYARYGLWVDSGSDLTVKVSRISIGPHWLEAPATIPLTEVRGEVPAALEVWGDVDVESDAHSVVYAIGQRRPAPITVEAEDLTWSGGNTTTLATLYDGAGTTGQYTGGATYGTTRKTATIDASHFASAAYELWVRGCVNNAAATATFDCDEASEGSATTQSTTPEWLSLGQVTLPPQRTLPGTSATITVGLTCDSASYYAYVDRYLFVPLDCGGAVTVHDADTPATDYSAVDVLADGTVLLDGAVDYTDVTPGPLLATADDELVVNAEKAASDEPTHLVCVVPLHTPLYSLWRDS